MWFRLSTPKTYKYNTILPILWYNLCITLKCLWIQSWSVHWPHLLFCAAVFLSAYGGWVSVFTAIAMCCFAFSTIIGWGLYGTRCIEFLFGSRANKLFMLVYALVAIVGATMNLGLMWSIAETFNGLMVIPNLIAVFLLSGVVVKLVKEYFAGEGKKQ